MSNRFSKEYPSNTQNTLKTFSILTVFLIIFFLLAICGAIHEAIWMRMPTFIMGSTILFAGVMIWNERMQAQERFPLGKIR